MNLTRLIYTSLQLFVAVLLLSCKTDADTATEKVNPHESKDLCFIDTTELTATLLYDNKYVLQISAEEDKGLGKYIGIRFGNYIRAQDTFFVDSPPLDSDLYTKIKTKYYWMEKQSVEVFNGKEYVPDSAYQRVLLISPNRLIDSLLNIKLSDSTTIVEVGFHKDTLILRNNKLRHK